MLKNRQLKPFSLCFLIVTRKRLTMKKRLFSLSLMILMLSSCAGEVNSSSGEPVFSSESSSGEATTSVSIGSSETSSEEIVYNYIDVNEPKEIILSSDSIRINAAGDYDISGTLLEGQIIVNVGDDEDVTLNLYGISITSSITSPLYIENANSVDISAKSGTENFIFDERNERVSDEDDGIPAAIYAQCDLTLKGSGALTVEGKFNNGIATKDDLEIKNETLNVIAVNNAIKGNDSLTIDSGIVTAISTKGDALKTENSDVSSKGNQRGTIAINGGVLNLYAACDAIDASYNVEINENPTINIYTDQYSPYSEEVSYVDENTLYVRMKSSIYSSFYHYSAYFSNGNMGSFIDLSYDKSLTFNDRGGQTTYYYYQLSRPNNYQYVTFFRYSAAQSSSQGNDYTNKTDQLTINESRDMFTISSFSSTSIFGSWETYSSSQNGGSQGGMTGGPSDEGNTDKGSYSTKGIKSDNEVIIRGGVIDIAAYDDAIHANKDVELENGSFGSGNVTINGGNLTIASNDDGIHADNTLLIGCGNITITKAYEAYEGTSIYINGGISNITSSDDGINAASDEASPYLEINDGVVFLDAGGDGLDSNGSIVMNGGTVVAIGPTDSGNGVLDFDKTFSFQGGLLLAAGRSGMNQKPTAFGISSLAFSYTYASSLSTNDYLIASYNEEVVAALKISKSNMNYFVYAVSGLQAGTYALSYASNYEGSQITGGYYVGGSKGTTIASKAVSSFPYNA